MTVVNVDPRRIALIGFGEVGKIFADGLVRSGNHDVAAYDILLDSPGASAIRDKARQLGVEVCASAAAVAANARIVISAVTASAARAVAEQAASYLRPGQLFLDINSVSPDTKRDSAAAVEKSGARYVEAAVMAPVPPFGIKVPILLGGGAGDDVAAILNRAGMKMEAVSAVVGQASAVKMCRSIMIKGLEALIVESMITARRYGVEDKVLASLKETYPGIDWNELAGYMIGRTIHHGRRRASEMREVADTVSVVGLVPLMASATAGRQDWVADQAAAMPELRSAKDKNWRTTLDGILAKVAAKTPQVAE
ncbi:MAG: NAD(P)-dependent oxidoreductase [Proteobacteria bacterium]|nr:NAD(P)-dependent oxidoreductase [Pseudomonadota bacterium]